MTTTTTRPTPDHLASVPHPAGVTYVSEWDPDPVPDPRRYFRGTKRVIDRSDDPYNDDLKVEVDGTQGPEGGIMRHVMVLEGNAERIELHSSDHARELGLALLAAADEWDQLTD
jgi:hypothetical protein